MNTMNPAQVAANRTARLVKEAKTPRYTSATPAPKPRQHKMMVEMEADTGYRSWSSPMDEDKVNGYIDSYPEGYMLSDVDHAGNCWCGGTEYVF